MRLWTRILPKTLRSQLLLMTLLMVSVPLSITGLVVDMKGREAREAEKLDKLYGLARMLDSELGPGFDQLLADYRGDPGDRPAKIAFLNRKLRTITDMVATAVPGTGVGYYSRDLDAIITYGPSQQYDNTVGIAIAPDHPGRQVMEHGEAMARVGTLVRGPIMNAMLPIIRDGRTIGYIWANELTSSIERQTREMDNTIAGVTLVGIVMGVMFAHALSRKLTNDIHGIKTGLARLQFDLNQTLRKPSGELGEITDAINAMAKALLDARSLNENILDSIADGVIAVDVDGRITSANPAACRMLGVTPRDILGHAYATLYPTQDKFISALLDTLRSGRDHIGIPREFPVGDQIVHVILSSSLLRDGTGTVIGAVAVLKDRSEQQRLHKQIMRADRLAGLGELVAGVAHEIRNPLTSIRGFMQYLESSNSIEEWQRYTPLIVRQVDSLNRIVTELLEFGRHRLPCIGPVEVNALIQEITVLVGTKTPARITLALSGDIPSIQADGEALKQVVLNLLLNAVQAIPDSGTVTIATEADPVAAHVHISVSDTGVGILPENLEKIFDPFFSTKPTGTGLGLAMAHRIVDAHHGTISVSSVPGTGTTVLLCLPIAQPIPSSETS
ncbi:MAG: two-component system sensor histidine kinase AtoS [Magnetospirillum sp.]|nr:two-component system sensor histidine kinase AtoS [Magnetospirillum sp.]